MIRNCVFFPLFLQELKIYLSPPPDLMVISITTLKNYYTGDVMEVRFNISNEGLGKPFHYWWRDRVVSRKLEEKLLFCSFQFFIIPVYNLCGYCTGNPGSLFVSLTGFI